MARDRGIFDLVRNVDNLQVVRVEESARQLFGVY